MDLEKKKLQFKKNDEIVITIEDLGKDGEGIGHVDGYALFVKGALPGEKVLVHLMKLNKIMALRAWLKFWSRQRSA